jgi:PPE-repeat protein
LFRHVACALSPEPEIPLPDPGPPWDEAEAPGFPPPPDFADVAPDLVGWGFGATCSDRDLRGSGFGGSGFGGSGFGGSGFGGSGFGGSGCGGSGFGGSGFGGSGFAGSDCGASGLALSDADSPGIPPTSDTSTVSPSEPASEINVGSEKLHPHNTAACNPMAPR